jgi:hypothetical protein
MWVSDTARRQAGLPLSSPGKMRVIMSAFRGAECLTGITQGKTPNAA